MPRGKNWNEDDKRKAVASYLLTRNVSESARICGIPRRTIQQWKDGQPEWWDRISQEVWADQEENMQAGCKEVIDLAFNGLIDRLQNGDVVIVQGKERRIPPKSLELAKVMGITMDKLNLLRGKPTSISARHHDDTTRDRLAELKAAVSGKGDKIVAMSAKRA